MYYIYVYLDPRKKGSYSYEDINLEYEPFYVGKGKGDRYLSHLKIAQSKRKGKFNRVISKIKSILDEGLEPIIIKVYENLTNENYSYFEIKLIALIGKIDAGAGTLLNTTDGGDGGKTWIGEHHNRGKKIEDIVGEGRAKELRANLSKLASTRTGTLNSNFGNRGKKNPLFGRKMNSETKNKIRQKTVDQFSKYSKDKIEKMVDHMRDRKNLIPDEIKKEWYKSISRILKEKKINGELFKPEHRKKLSDTNYKKINKGSDLLKISDETKKKDIRKIKR